MSTVLGLLFLIGGIILLFTRQFLRTEETVREETDRFNRTQTIREPASNPLLLTLSSKPIALGIAALGILFIFQSSFWFYANQGRQYHVLTPTGQKYMINTTGIKFVMPFSKIQEWQKFIDIKTVTEGETTEGIEGVIVGGIPVRFIDQVTGNVSISTRMQIPSDEASFLALVEEFRDQDNLINNTLIPTVREQTINTGYMFAAQDYVSGSAADFRTTLDEQLKDGGYSVEKKEIQDTTFLNVDIQQEGDRQIKDIRTTYEVTKRTGRDGKPIRVPHDITKNNIMVSQVIVDQVSLEGKFKERLEAQRDISAQKRIEMEKIETAKAAQQRIVAEGERDKASERVTQEKEQVKKLIAIETEKKQEETRKELAEIALETAKINAQKMRVEAEAKRVQLQLADGLSEEAKYRIDKEVEARVGVAKALAGPQGMTLPQMYMGGGQGNNTTSSQDMMSQILMMMMAQQSLEKKGGN